MGELRSLAMISGGMVLGSMGGKAIDKMLKVDETVTGFQVKKLVRPMALLGAGVLGSMKLKNQDLKMVSAGVGAAGVVSTVKVVLKKDLLAGLDGGVAGLGEAMSVYHEPVRMIAQMLFFQSDERCLTTYRDRGGKYQGQTGVTLPKA